MIIYRWFPEVENIQNDEVRLKVIQIRRLSRDRKWKDACNILKEAKVEKVEPLLPIYNATIHACTGSREMGVARKLFEEMRAQEIAPDVLTFSDMISGYLSQQNVRIFRLSEISH